MGRKKKISSEGQPSQPSETEQKLRQMAMENEQMKKVLKDREDQIKKFQEVEAMGRLAGVPSPTSPAEDELAAALAAADEDPEPSPVDSAAEPPELMKTGAFERTLERFNERSEGIIDIFRVKENGVEAKIGSFNVKDWGSSLEKCAKTYGGGEFKAILRDGNGRYAGVTTVIYDEDAYPRPNKPAVLPGSSAADMTEMLRLMQAQQDKQQDQFMKLLTVMMASSKMNGVPSTPAHDPLELVETMMRLKKLVEPAQEAVSPMKDAMTLLTLFQKGMETGERMAPVAAEQPKEEAGLMSLLSSFLPAVAPAVGQFLSGQGTGASPSRGFAEAIKAIQHSPAPRPLPAAQPGAAPLPASPLVPPTPLQAAAAPAAASPAAAGMGAAAAAAAPQNPEAKSMGFGSSFIVNMYKGLIIDMAEKNFQVDEAARLIMARIPADYYPFCLDFCSKPDRIDLLAELAPEARKYESWLNGVLDFGKVALTEYFEELRAEEAEEVLEIPAKGPGAEKTSEVPAEQRGAPPVKE